MEQKRLCDLSEDEQLIVRKSQEAMSLAYARYSNFPVGAALKLRDGSIILGCNVENSAYGLTICAEQTALVSAVARGIALRGNLEVVAVSANTTGQLITPCGACRQFIGEFNPSAKVYLHNPDNGIVGLTTLNFLLPGCFDFETATNGNKVNNGAFAMAQDI